MPWKILYGFCNETHIRILSTVSVATARGVYNFRMCRARRQHVSSSNRAAIHLNNKNVRHGCLKVQSNSLNVSSDPAIHWFRPTSTSNKYTYLCIIIITLIRDVRTFYFLRQQHDIIYIIIYRRTLFTFPSRVLYTDENDEIRFHLHANNRRRKKI